MRGLVNGLHEVFSDLEKVCEEIYLISDEIDELNSVEDIKINIELCVAMVTDHLDSRRDEPASTETSSWVAKHALSSNDSQRSLEFHDNVFPHSYGGGGARPRDSHKFLNISSRDTFGVKSDFSAGGLACQPPDLSSLGVYENGYMDNLRGLHVKHQPSQMQTNNRNVEYPSEVGDGWNNRRERETSGINFSLRSECVSSHHNDFLTSDNSQGDDDAALNNSQFSAQNVRDPRGVLPLTFQNSRDSRRAQPRNNVVIPDFSAVRIHPDVVGRAHSDIGALAVAERGPGTRSCVSDTAGGFRQMKPARAPDIAGVAGARNGQDLTSGTFGDHVNGASRPSLGGSLARFAVDQSDQTVDQSARAVGGANHVAGSRGSNFVPGASSYRHAAPNSLPAQSNVGYPSFPPGGPSSLCADPRLLRPQNVGCDSNFAPVVPEYRNSSHASLPPNVNSGGHALAAPTNAVNVAARTPYNVHNTDPVRPVGNPHVPHSVSSVSSDDSVSVAGGNVGGHVFAKSPTVANMVDSWIDDLDPAASNTKHSWMQGGVSAEAMMGWMVQQHLPQVELPSFSGSPGEWVNFITKFRDVVHIQGYLNDGQRMRFLLQQLNGEAEKAVKGFANDATGYVLALKKLKKLFGQRSMVARAVLTKVTKGKPVDDDAKQISEFLYCISDCLITLKQLNYASDLHSSDTLHQALQRLPRRLLAKWSEKSQTIRQHEEPNLVHLEAWLQDRVLAMKEMNLCSQKPSKKKEEPKVEKFSGATMTNDDVPKTLSCPLCKKSGHSLGKCDKYKSLSPEKRMKTARELKLCFNCLTDGHPRQECSSRYKCFASDCGRRHHTSLHDFYADMVRAKKEEEKRRKDTGNDSNAKKDGDKKDGDKKGGDKKVDAKKDQADAGGDDGDEKLTGMTTVANKEIILQIVPVTLHSPDGKMVDTYALLDGGSQVTLVREDVCEKLGLDIEERTTRIKTVKDVAEPLKTGAVSLEISDRNGEVWFEVDDALTCEPGRFNMPRRPRLTGKPDSDMYKHLEGLDLQEIHADDVTILIGADVAEAHTPIEVRKGSKGQPVARKMPFGWCVFGPSSVTGGEHAHCGTVYTGEEVQSLWDPTEEPPALHVGLLLSPEDEALHHSLERFWCQEHCGILPSNELGLSKEDKRALATLEDETRNVGDRYEIPMLWCSPETTLPNNYPMALRRFKSMEKRLRGDQALQEGCQAVMRGYLAVDPPYARKMTIEEARQTSHRTWHMPVHPVTNVHKPGKIRLVNDGAAEYQGKSLNKALVTGPDLLSNLVGILLRLRLDRIAIAADLEAMFHQVRVSKEDSDSLRFLWKEDFNSDEPPDTYQMLVHIFGAKDSSTICSYAVKRTARDNWSKFSPLTLEAALKSFYVDDLLKSLRDEETAVQVATELIELLKLGGFRLCKFTSNSRVVLEALPQSEVSPSAIVNLEDGACLERALGVSWDTTQDVFTFFSEIKDAPMTKRGILRTTSSLYDPFGFLTPFILKAKILLQELWREKLEWDEEVREVHQKYWKKWLDGVKNVSLLKLRRWYLVEYKPIAEVQLHVFCDASELAYGTVAYLRFVFKDGMYHVAFVMSKSRLAPIKSITLPRLELNAARCGARLSRLVLHEIDLPIEYVRYWSDSTLTLQYIKNDKHRPKVFVSNRQTEILEVSDADQWSHISGSLNPADLLTRGVVDPLALNSTSWFTGPDFLLHDEEFWPKSDVGELDPNDVEIRQRSVLVGLGMIMEAGDIDTSRFSTWLRMKRVIAWIIRFLENVRLAVEDRERGCLTVEELKDSEKVIVKDSQATSFDQEIRLLSQGKSLSDSNRLSPLCPFIDSEGVLRVGGRLADLDIPLPMKHPPILDRSHHSTKLLIEWTHRRNGHVGTDHVLALIREAYWILSGRIAVNQVVHRCFLCRVRRARKQFPFMANLPKCRAAIDEPPFTHCGVDLFGPITIKQGRKQLKRWACLFTCLTVRCVHLEVLDDCETDTFINATRRFVGRRGCPTHVYSDNGTNFRGATSELKEFVQKLDKEKIIEFASVLEIKWTFNPPKAPHMGGAWERLVRSVKEVMYGLLKNHILTDPQLYTLLVEAEAIVNSRPLTYLSENADDLCALTPNHILLGRHRNWTSIADTSELDVFSRKKYKQVQAVTTLFWSRWKSEYLPTLTTRPKGWREQTVPFREGDLVLVHDDDTKRGQWPLARVQKVMPGKDGVVRTVEVRTKKGSYTRPVAKLYRLEDDIRQGGENVGNLAN